MLFHKTNQITLRSVSVVLISGLLLSGASIPSYAVTDPSDSTLAPPLSTQSQGNTPLHNEWMVAEIGRLIYPILRLSQEGKYHNPTAILISHIKKNIRNKGIMIEMLSKEFNIDGIEEAREGGEITGFTLPVTKNGTPACRLVYNLQGGETAIQLKDGKSIYVTTELVASRQEIDKGSIATPQEIPLSNIVMDGKDAGIVSKTQAQNGGYKEGLTHNVTASQYQLELLKSDLAKTEARLAKMTDETPANRRESAINHIVWLKKQIKNLKKRVALQDKLVLSGEKLHSSTPEAENIDELHKMTYFEWKDALSERSLRPFKTGRATSVKEVVLRLMKIREAEGWTEEGIASRPILLIDYIRFLIEHTKPNDPLVITGTGGDYEIGWVGLMLGLNVTFTDVKDWDEVRGKTKKYLRYLGLSPSYEPVAKKADIQALRSDTGLKDVKVLTMISLPEWLFPEGKSDYIVSEVLPILVDKAFLVLTKEEHNAIKSMLKGKYVLEDMKGYIYHSFVKPAKFYQISRIKKDTSLLPHPKVVAKATNPKSTFKDTTTETERIHAANFQDMLTYIQTQPQAQPLIVALGTKWMRGYERNADGKSFKYLQGQDLNELITSIRSYCESKGIPFIVDDDDKLPTRISAERAKDGGSGAKIVVLAGENAVKSDEFAGLRADEKNTLVVGVNNQELTTDSYIRLMEMLTLALKLSAGFEISLDNAHIAITKDNERHLYIFLPHAEPMDYERLKVIYEVQKFA